MDLVLGKTVYNHGNVRPRKTCRARKGVCVCVVSLKNIVIIIIFYFLSRVMFRETAKIENKY